MKKTTTHALFCLLAAGMLSIGANAQSSSGSGSGSTNTNKLFTEWGYSPFLGYSSAPLTTNNEYYVSSYDPITNNPIYSPVTVTSRFTTYDIFTLLFRVRYNLVEMSNNSSLSISAFPGLGLSSSTASISDYNVSQNGNGGASGALSLCIPIFLDLNLGNVSTYSSDQDKGFVVGIGVEYTMAPLLGIVQATGYTDANGTVGPIPTTSVWVEPVLELGYRYWNKKNKAKEFNLKFGYGAAGAFSAQLSWMKCIGY